MALVETLVDEFDTLNTSRWGVWNDGSSNPTVVGGRLRMPASNGGSTSANGYAGAETGPEYTLQGSSVFVEVPTVPANPGNGDEVYATFKVISPTGNDGDTYAEIMYDVADGVMRFHTATGWDWDSGDVSIPYNAAQHRWWRIELLSSGEDPLRFYTSPDGATWTQRRAMAAPSWMTASASRDEISVALEAGRNGNGTDDYAEFDNLNVAPVADPPVVNAGADATITVEDTFTRTATNSGGAADTWAWTIQSGPADVGSTIGTAAALSWTPTVVGAYTLRATATNTGGSDFDEITVTVQTGGGSGTGHRFYLTNTAPNPAPSGSVSLVPFDQVGQVGGSNISLRAAATAPGGTAASAEGTETVDNTTDTQRLVALGAFVTPPIERAGTFGGAGFTGVVAVQESAAAADFRLVVFVRVRNPDGTLKSSVATVIVNSAGEWPTTLTGLAFTVTESSLLTEQSVAPGDFISIEVGYYAANNSTTPYTGTLRFGGTDSTPLAAGDTGANALNRPGWIELLDPDVGDLWVPLEVDGTGSTGLALGQSGSGQRSTSGDGSTGLALGAGPAVKPGDAYPGEAYPGDFYPGEQGGPTALAIRRGAGEPALAFGATGTGRKLVTGTGRAGLALDATGGGPRHTSGSGSTTLALDARHTAEAVRAGAGSTGLVLDADGQGSPVRTGQGSTSLALGVDGQPGIVARSGAGSASLALNEGGTGSVERSGGGRSTLHLDEHGGGPAKRTGTGSTGILLGESGRGRPSGSGYGSTGILLGQRGEGLAVRRGTGRSGIALGASGGQVGPRDASGTGTTGLALGQRGTGSGARSGSGRSTLALAAHGAGAGNRPGSGTAHLALDAQGTGSGARPGSGTAHLALGEHAAPGPVARRGTGRASLHMGQGGYASTRDGAAGTSLALGEHGTGRKVATGTGRTSLALGQTGTGRKEVGGTGSTGLRLGVEPGLGERTSRGRGRGELTLAARSTGTRSTSGPGRVLVQLGQRHTGSGVRSGSASTGLTLGQRSDGRRLGRGAGRSTVVLGAAGGAQRRVSGHGTASLRLGAWQHRVVPGRASYAWSTRADLYVTQATAQGV